MNPLNSDDFLRGFNDGKKAAEEGRERDYIRMGMSLKFAIHGSKALDSYAEGYKKGYEEALRKSVVQKVEMVSPPTPQNDAAESNTSEAVKGKTNTNRVYYNNNFNTTSHTMNAQQIEAQVEAMRQLLIFLNETIQDLHTRMQTYNDKVSALREVGLAEEVANNYDQNYCIPNNQKLWQVTDSMEQNDRRYIEDTIAQYEQLLEIARKNYNN